MPVGRKKAPSWKKICFQLENYFFPTGNLVFGGYWLFISFSAIFPVQDLRNTAKTKVKRFDNILDGMMLLKLFKGVPV